MNIDTSLFLNIGLLLSYLIIFAVAAQEITNIFKPVFVSFLPKDADGDVKPDSEQLYLFLIYITRSGSALIILAGSNGLAGAVAILPWIGTAPPLGALIVLALIAGVGADGIHKLLDLGGAIILRLTNPQPAKA